ncbi:PRC-barrel domain-containing protein [Streptomyces sp. MUM 178J]|uniref:PRC-barrel domain-containing protein n=1 Tax=Streptomyces sp. MUM 178J TaxID=2791991 RepID=UPI001F0442AE|nr:PRC-barrel domain-containing protein [Streptomyces sp. MUM 178J]WRQ78173.1 PRC-barrel domain-containing protein [Streptomyces sp. MUM 178J]
MTEHLLAREITGKPVVTLAGEDVAQVKDIVFDPVRGSVRCFTLSGRGFFAGPLKRALLWKKVHALGPDAVMIRDAAAMEEDDEAARRDDTAKGGGNVLGAQIMTEGGTALGKVTDAVLATGTTPRVVGYEIETADRRRALVPVIKPVAVSGELVIVPDATADFSAGDLAGLSAAAAGLRDRLDQEK